MVVTRTRAASLSRLDPWAPPVALMTVIFALSAQPDLSTGLGVWEFIGRTIVHTAAPARPLLAPTTSPHGRHPAPHEPPPPLRHRPHPAPRARAPPMPAASPPTPTRAPRRPGTKVCRNSSVPAYASDMQNATA